MKHGRQKLLYVGVAYNGCQFTISTDTDVTCVVVVVVVVLAIIVVIGVTISNDITPIPTKTPTVDGRSDLKFYIIHIAIRTGTYRFFRCQYRWYNVIGSCITRIRTVMIGRRCRLVSHTNNIGGCRYYFVFINIIIVIIIWWCCQCDGRQ